MEAARGYLLTYLPTHLTHNQSEKNPTSRPKPCQVDKKDHPLQQPQRNPPPPPSSFQTPSSRSGNRGEITPGAMGTMCMERGLGMPSLWMERGLGGGRGEGGRGFDGEWRGREGWGGEGRGGEGSGGEENVGKGGEWEVGKVEKGGCERCLNWRSRWEKSMMKGARGGVKEVMRKRKRRVVCPARKMET